MSTPTPSDTDAHILNVLHHLGLPFAPHITAAEVCQFDINSAGETCINIAMGFACQAEHAALKSYVHNALALEGITPPPISIRQDISAVTAKNSQNTVEKVKNIIAVASGKGGVGKSTTSVNLAVALHKQGAKVGLLDADIYGPSQHHMLGVASKRPDVAQENKITPINAHGISVISMGNLVTKQTPMVWRGPMVSGALQQLINNADWGELDYLIIDMPPGTGDIQLTLSQTVPVSGAVVVTTPQDIALLDAVKGIEMFSKVNIPVLGVVENMATHVCSQCGHEEAIFGDKGGERLARDYHTQILGQLPLNMAIREGSDNGKPVVSAQPESPEAKAYMAMALQVGAACWRTGLSTPSAPDIQIND